MRRVEGGGKQLRKDHAPDARAKQPGHKRELGPCDHGGKRRKDRCTGLCGGACWVVGFMQWSLLVVLCYVVELVSLLGLLHAMELVELLGLVMGLFFFVKFAT